MATLGKNCKASQWGPRYVLHRQLWVCLPCFVHTYERKTPEHGRRDVRPHCRPYLRNLNPIQRHPPRLLSTSFCTRLSVAPLSVASGFVMRVRGRERLPACPPPAVGWLGLAVPGPWGMFVVRLSGLWVRANHRLIGDVKTHSDRGRVPLPSQAPLGVDIRKSTLPAGGRAGSDFLARARACRKQHSVAPCGPRAKASRRIFRRRLSHSSSTPEGGLWRGLPSPWRSARHQGTRAAHTRGGAQLYHMG